MAAFEDELAQLDQLTNEMAARLEEYERVNSELRAAVENNDTDRAAALAAQSAAHAESIAAINAKLRGVGQGGTPLPDDTEPLPPVTPSEPLG